jgi:beta-glucosidase
MINLSSAPRILRAPLRLCASAPVYRIGRVKCITASLLSCILLASIAQAQSSKPPYKNPSLPIDQRVADLLSRMTPEEKFWQLFMIPSSTDVLTTPPDKQAYKNGIFGFQLSAAAQGNNNAEQMLKYNATESGAVVVKKLNAIQKYFVDETRLGIPIIAFDEALHGLVREGATSFPQAIALAATFDTLLMSRVATAIATESKARGIRQILSPVINIATDVRWGRVEETYGEDPFLQSEMGVAFVRPFEKMGIITTPKHLIANVGDGGRDSYPIHLNERYLEEIHFPPFKAVFTRGGTRSVMTSYNSLDGSPMSANDWMLNQKLKKEWKFDGFVISDAGAVGGSLVLHNTSPEYATSGAQTINAGMDVIFQTAYDHYKLFLPAFLDGRVDSKKLDEAVGRVLKAKFQLGLFENPYITADHLKKISAAEQKNIAREASIKSMVLLKNENQTLPLSKQIKSIAVIGSDATEGRLGGYSGPGNGVVTLLQGIKKRAGNVKVNYAAGADRNETEWSVIPSANLKTQDGKPGLTAEYFNNIDLSGKASLTRTDAQLNFHWTLYGPDEKLGNSFYSARWTGYISSPKSGKIKIGLDGNDGFRLYINNKILIDRWTKQTYSTELVDFNFEKDQPYFVRVEFKETVGNAHIRLIWDADVKSDWEQKIDEAVQVAKQSDVAIVVAGIHEGEFQDRALLSLPGHQEELINSVAATGKPVVVVLVGGSAITMDSWINNVSSILDIWYPGEEGGNALAQVLFGDASPAGRLPITFPKHEAQLPLVYNHKPTGRGDDYHNMSGLPLFPFGYGLTYTTFEYSDIRIERLSIKKNESTQVQFELKNTGTFESDEVVQLYIKDELASVSRPVLELKGFQRVHLKPGESKTLNFVITPEMLEMLDAQLKAVVEPGEFRVMIGGSSRDIYLNAVLEVVE